MRGIPGRALPGLAETLERNLEAARLTSPGVRAVGICLNTSRLDRAAAADDLSRNRGLARLAVHRSDWLSASKPIIDELLCVERSARATTVSR